MKGYFFIHFLIAVGIIAFALFNAIRSMVNHSGGIYVFLFGCLAYVGYKFFFRATMDELREYRKRKTDKQ